MAVVQVDLFTQTRSLLVSHVPKIPAMTYSPTGSATATSQAVEAATSVSDMFQENTADGLVGLSFGDINTVQPNKVPTFFDNIKPTLSQALFAADLKKGAAGSYDFGVSPPP